MQLTTERLILRDFVADDWQAVMAYQSDPRYLKYYEWTERTPEAVQEFVSWFTDQQKEQPRIRFQLAITLPETAQQAGGQLIGNCGVRMDKPGAHQADVGYELDPNFWGQGCATEAARRMVRYSFEELGVHRIWSWCIAENTASAHVLEKLGMRLEGRLRDAEYFKGRYWDTLMFGMLCDETRHSSL